MCNGWHGFGDLDGFAVARCTAGVSTQVSFSERGAMPEAGGSDQKHQTVTNDSSPDAKIELFQSLFCGGADTTLPCHLSNHSSHEH